MRFFLTLLLVVLILFNATFAAAAAICDVGETGAPHGWHMGHHEHGHDHDHDDADNDVAPDNDPPTGDGHHTHAHPTFTPLFLILMPQFVPTGNETRYTDPLGILVSAPPTRLERPPRTAPVA